MSKTFSLLVAVALLALVGCGDSTGPDDDDDDDDENPTVAAYTGTDELGGMNVSGFFVTTATDTIALDTLLTLEMTGTYSADFIPVSSGGTDQTEVTMDMATDDQVFENRDGNPRRLFAEVKLEVPGSSTGTFEWEEDNKVDIRIAFDYDDGEVTYLDVVEATIVLTENDPQTFPSRSTAGTFSAVLKSPQGKKIAVNGRFGE